MQANQQMVYRRTEAGLVEMRKRRLDLPPKLRAILFFIDGATPVARLVQEATVLGLRPDFLEQLEKLRLVEAVVSGAAAKPAAAAANDARVPVGAEFDVEHDPFSVAQNFMIDTVVDALGIRSFLFTLKIERCSALDDLRELAVSYRDAIAKATSAAQAELLHRRLLEMLGPAR